MASWFARQIDEHMILSLAVLVAIVLSVSLTLASFIHVTPLSVKVNRACAAHGGVERLDNSSPLVICRDGVAQEIP